MPFTPFHLGPALLFGLVLFSYLDFPTFLVANVIVDIEPFTVLALGLNLPLHGFFHSLLGGTMISLILAFAMMRIGKFLRPLMSYLNMEQTQSVKSVLAASLSGVYLHIFLDARLYTDIKPFYPYTVNPLFSGSMSAGFEVYGFCVLSALVGAVLYFFKIRRTRR